MVVQYLRKLVACITVLDVLVAQYLGVLVGGNGHDRDQRKHNQSLHGVCFGAVVRLLLSRENWDRA